MSVNSQTKSSKRIKLKEALRQIPQYPRTFQLIWDATHGLTIAWAILLIVQGLLPVAIVYLTKFLVDGFVALQKTTITWSSARPLIIEIALMVGTLLLSEIIQSGLEWVRTAQAEYAGDYITGMIHEKSCAVDLAFYESPEYYDHLHRARSEATSRSLAFLESTGSLVQNSITLVAMAAVLIPYSVWLPLFLFLGTLPALFVVFRYNTQYHQWWEKTTTDRRWTQYYDYLITNNYVAHELRLFNLGQYFQNGYKVIRRRLRSERLQIIKKQSISRFLAGLFAFMVTGAVTLWMVLRAIRGVFTLGDLALFYQAYSRGQGLMRSLLGNLGQIYANSLFLSNLYEFLELEPGITDPPEPIETPEPLKKGIQFDEITFRYPGSSDLVLEDFAINFPAGKITAIVGPNGAGKSTLIKLLCRFYDPEDGKIEIDGIDIRALSIDELRRMITIMFQQPVTYYATAAQNIAFGDHDLRTDLAEIERAARGSGAHEIIARLPQGYDTFLGKLFAGGTELSVGEWQRIALSRAFLRRGQIVVLDEPTSSMDPWAEADWMERFRTLVEGRTSIIITHRFTTAKYADIIHVMKDGKIIESGSHEELLALDQLYAQSWNTQTNAKSMLSREAYRDNGLFSGKSV